MHACKQNKPSFKSTTIVILAMYAAVETDTTDSLEARVTKKTSLLSTSLSSEIVNVLHSVEPIDEPLANIKLGVPWM